MELLINEIGTRVETKALPEGKGTISTIFIPGLDGAVGPLHKKLCRALSQNIGNVLQKDFLIDNQSQIEVSGYTPLEIRNLLIMLDFVIL